MKLTNGLFTALLLVFVNSAGAADSAPAPQADTPRVEHQLVVYYFHGNFRCKTCKAMEAYTREALESGFPEELQKGRIEFRLTNMDSDENEHFVSDFQLSTRSVVIADSENGKQTRWKRLDRIWDLVGDKPAFLAYVQGEVDPWLSESK